MSKSESQQRFALPLAPFAVVTIRRCRCRSRVPSFRNFIMLNEVYRNYRYHRLENPAKMSSTSDLYLDLDSGPSSFVWDLILTKNKRKKRVWIISSVVLAVVIALVVAAIILLTTSTDESDAQVSDALSLEDLLVGNLNYNTFNATWVSGTEMLYRDNARNVVLKDVAKNTSVIILSATEEILTNAFEVTLSPDHNYLLVGHTYAKLYRYSFTAQYTIIDLESGETFHLAADDTPAGTYMQYATWGHHNSSLVFVHRSNIYYKSAVTSHEVLQITTDGSFGTIYNGVPDWVYEEEVFNSNVALWISPDGRKIAYARFDDSKVAVMSIPYYGEPGSLNAQYTHIAQIRYPKPGTNNPEVTLHVVDLSNITTVKQLAPPSNLQSGDHILSGVSWATDDIVAAIWMNRIQNESSVLTYNTAEDQAQTVTEFSQPNGWLELFTPPLFSKDGTRFLMIVSQDQGNASGSYRHLTMFTREDGSSQALTMGKFVVTEIVGWNEDANLIYYLATTEENPGAQHLYSVSTIENDTHCISCQVTSSDGANECLYNTAHFSSDFSHYVLNCEGPGVPEVSLFTSDHNKVEIWDSNDNLKSLVGSKRVPTMEKFVFTVADGFSAHVSLKLPPNFDGSGETKYPMLVNVYAGPDSYQISERFNMDWGSYLAANKSIIYAMIDGRGSGLKGDKIMFEIYRRLGTVEIADQINVTRQLQSTLGYIDSSRTAIWGWSYGGYATGMVLATDTANVFKCGMSVAPVTDWALYDSIYTERFMGLPTTADNYAGYSQAQLINKYEGLKSKQFFLIHGTLDDNVHYQQSMLLSKILEQKDILFRQQSYPDESHGLASVRPHLYHSLEKFLNECFSHEVSD